MVRKRTVVAREGEPARVTVEFGADDLKAGKKDPGPK
jgi:hypothetical protein